jgi:beta-galactosidase
VEVVRRSDGEASWLFVVNHEEQDVELAATGTEQLSGARCDAALPVPAGGVRILREDPAR